MAVKMNKKNKASIARKNAEALKAKKKANRMSRGSAAVATHNGKKGKSSVGQSKKK